MKTAINDESAPSEPEISVSRSSEDELWNRSCWFVTEEHQYYFRVRNSGYTSTLGRSLREYETEALALWSLGDKRELEDVVAKLGVRPVPPELVAMILLTGRSIKAASDIASKAGKAKASKYDATKEFIQDSWKHSAAKFTKAGFAAAVVMRMREANKKRQLNGEPPLEIPSADTARKYLTGVEKLK